VSVIVLYIVYTIISNIIENRKLNKYDQIYSKKIDINGHKMSYNIVGEKNNQTIVLLPGVGSPSSIIEFKPLAEALSDKYKIITLEPFGYGFSDDLVDNRTLDTMTSAFRECTKKIGINHYYVLGHSMSGFYTLNWANKFNSEVDGVIGLDPSTYQPELVAEEKEFDRMRFFREIGIFRLSNLFNKPYLDLSYKYTDEEIDIYIYLINNRSYTKGVVQDYHDLIDYNLKTFRDVKFPDNIPVLEFFASDTIGVIKDWEKLHYNQLGNNIQNEIIKMDGSHYIHYNQKDAIVKKIKEWIN